MGWLEWLLSKWDVPRDPLSRFRILLRRRRKNTASSLRPFLRQFKIALAHHEIERRRQNIDLIYGSNSCTVAVTIAVYLALSATSLLLILTLNIFVES